MNDNEIKEHKPDGADGEPEPKVHLFLGADGNIHPVSEPDKVVDFESIMDYTPDDDTGPAALDGADGGADKAGDAAEQDSGASKIRMEIYDWLQCIVSAVICGIFLFVFVGRTIGVEGDSMRQTLHWNDRIIMSNLFYTPKNGDIIVFHASSEVFGGTPLVKRVIAIAGQTIDINFDTGEVFVDGVVQDEPYINELTSNRINFQGPEVVPEGYVFVMGDNRNHSSDSRDSRVGMVDTRYILGKVLFIAIPGQDSNTPRDWGRFGPVNGW